MLLIFAAIILLMVALFIIRITKSSCDYSETHNAYPALPNAGTHSTSATSSQVSRISPLSTNAGTRTVGGTITQTARAMAPSASTGTTRPSTTKRAGTTAVRSAPPPLPPRRPQQAQRTRSLLLGPDGEMPHQFPRCPYCRRRNILGSEQQIFWNATGQYFRCLKGHLFKANGMPF